MKTWPSSCIRLFTILLLARSCAEETLDDECIGADFADQCAFSALQRHSRRLVASGFAADLVKGISYGPMPCKGQCAIHMDDFMGEASKPLWGPRGRGDLQIIKSLGANHVRLYGNSPESSHGAFLDEAHSLGLSVVVGNSDYPYTQMQNNCMSTGFDCYDVIKAVYTMNLLNGFMTQDHTYHPSLSQVIIINEPDLKLPGIAEPKKFAKGIISALDGMLDAEKEAGIQGQMINFTATFSFGICGSCSGFTADPALGQMYEIQEALLNPAAFGYTPRNNLSTIYRTRWVHSFNTNAPASFIKTAFLEKYEASFRSTPVVIQEFHTPGKNPQADLHEMLSAAKRYPLLQGVSFFEYQVRYDKGGTEMAFGMFGLGNYSITSFEYYGSSYESWCLVPTESQYGSVPQLVADAFGGPGPDYVSLCHPNPSKVMLSAAGFAEIMEQGATSIAVFAARLVQHRGSYVKDQQSLQQLSQSVNSYEELLEEIRSAGWIAATADTRCVADRLSDAMQVAAAVEVACGEMTWNCSSLPQECNGSVWSAADVVFTHYFAEKKGDPLQNCYFNGSALLAGPGYEARKCGLQCCDYNGGHPMPPTPKPTLPPIFGTPSPSNSDPKGLPELPPELVGDCSFQNRPAIQYFWDTSCDPTGGAGCMADGSHLECRFCGQSPFPDCPSAGAL